jgi:hypothetical protein
MLVCLYFFATGIEAVFEGHRQSKHWHYIDNLQCINVKAFRFKTPGILLGSSVFTGVESRKPIPQRLSLFERFSDTFSGLFCSLAPFPDNYLSCACGGFVHNDQLVRQWWFLVLNL